MQNNVYTGPVRSIEYLYIGLLVPVQWFSGPVSPVYMYKVCPVEWFNGLVQRSSIMVQWISAMV